MSKSLTVTLDHVDSLTGITADVTICDRKMQFVYVHEKAVFQLVGVHDLGEAMMLLDALQRTNRPAVRAPAPAQPAQVTPAAEVVEELVPMGVQAKAAFDKIVATLDSGERINEQQATSFKNNLALLLKNKHIEKNTANKLFAQIKLRVVTGQPTPQPSKPMLVPSPTPAPAPAPIPAQPEPTVEAAEEPETNGEISTLEVFAPLPHEQNVTPAPAPVVVASGERVERDINGKTISLLASAISAPTLQTAVDEICKSGSFNADQVVEICEALKHEIPGFKLSHNLDKRVRMKLAAKG